MRPESAVKRLKTRYKLGRDVIGEERNIRISSANREHFCSASPQHMPFMSWWFLSFIARGSNAKINRIGERGAPLSRSPVYVNCVGFVAFYLDFGRGCFVQYL